MSDTPKRDALLAMVPLYVNGTLGAEEKRAFEAALADNSEVNSELDPALGPELRRALDRETALQQRFVAELDAALGPDDPPADTKMQSLFGGAGQPETAGGGVAGGVAGALSFLNPANWKPAITFALAAAAVGQAAFIGSQSSKISDLEEENYQLASGQGDCEKDAAIIVEIVDGAPWGEVMALLDAQQMAIAGSGSFGVLQLRHANADTVTDAKTDAVIAALAASPLIISAERVN